MTNPSTSTRSQYLLSQAEAAITQMKPRHAGELAAQVLLGEPENAKAHYLLGLAAMELHRPDRAVEHLQKAVRLDPKSAGYAVHYAKALTLVQRLDEALPVANAASALHTDDPSVLSILGTVYGHCNAHERAVSTFRRSIALGPDNAICRFNFAISLCFLGEVEIAEKELEASLVQIPQNWLAHGIISRLRRQTTSSNHIDRLLALIDKTRNNPLAQNQLNMALGKEYEDIGEYAKAFEHFSHGNAAIKNGHRYKIESDEALVDALTHAFSEHQQRPAGYPSDEPIFIIGMPRSGTTLVERIISSHPEVYSAGELLNFGVALGQLSGEKSSALLSPVMIERSCHLDYEQLGRRYLSSTRPLTANKPRFIDKFPHNFFHAGFIANALPNARIICLRRDPMDTCLSNFREPFAETSPFHGYSFDLEDIGRYYILFDRLMAHWRRVLPNRILEIEYETLVQSPEEESRKLLDHCGLPWNEACLHFERNQAAAATASSTQVRSPIYKTAIKRWKKYGNRLDALQKLLNENGITTA